MLYFGLIFAVSLFCLGLRAITDEGMIGYPIRLFALKHFPKIGKPLVLCATCMSSFWGTIIYWLYFFNHTSGEIDLASFCYWIAISISSAFVNAVLWEYYASINSCKK